MGTNKIHEGISVREPGLRNLACCRSYVKTNNVLSSASWEVYSEVELGIWFIPRFVPRGSGIIEGRTHLGDSVSIKVQLNLCLMAVVRFM